MTSVSGGQAQRSPIQALAHVAKGIIKAAEGYGVRLRALGGVGVWFHCPRMLSFGLSQRRYNYDLDFVGLREQEAEVVQLLEDSRCSLTQQPHYYDRGVHRLYESVSESGTLSLDVYLGDLSFNHDIPGPYFVQGCNLVLPITQLLLSKLAIVELGTKDVVDLLAILCEHDIGDGPECETIESRVLMKAWADGCGGWGITKTCLNSIDVVRKRLIQREHLDPAIQEVVLERLDKLELLTRKSPKSACWKTRSVLGTHVRWYHVVESEVSILDPEVGYLG
jgi:hypothetical protein